MLKISTILLRSFFRNESRKYPQKEEWCVKSTTVRMLQTIAEAYRQICEGEEPWIALGNFRNAWYGHAKDRRVELVSEPLGKPAQDTEFANRWGAFCAATVEFLCERYDILCPQWVHDPGYTLETPWWHTERADDPKILKRLVQTTPEAFARRKIFCGNRLYQNKYEMSAWVQEARAQGITNPGDVWRYARQKEISIHGG
jgi:hypothetical protein